MSIEAAIAQIPAAIERREDEIVALREVMAMLQNDRGVAVATPEPPPKPRPPPPPARRKVTLARGAAVRTKMLRARSMATACHSRRAWRQCSTR
jgi:hypothetical protein